MMAFHVQIRTSIVQTQRMTDGMIEDLNNCVGEHGWAVGEAFNQKPLAPIRNKKKITTSKKLNRILVPDRRNVVWAALSNMLGTFNRCMNIFRVNERERVGPNQIDLVTRIHVAKIRQSFWGPAV